MIIKGPLVKVALFPLTVVQKLAALFFLLFFFFNLPYSFSQNKLVLTGKVADFEDKQPMPNATIQIKESEIVAVADQQGVFGLALDQGVYKVSVSYVGYEEFETEVTLFQNQHLLIFLKPKEIITDELIVEGHAEKELESNQTGRYVLKQEDIEKLPHFLGEIDPIKAIQFLPGVQTSGEGNTGFFVRGGGMDQNLILLDETPVYNAGHLFGFFSVFNGSTIDRMELLKGGISSQYGGRLSSVLSLTTKTGSKTNARSEGSLGVVAGSFLAEAPINKKISVTVAGRRTYLDLLTKSVLKKANLFDNKLGYYFYDLNATIDYQTKKDKVHISGYTGEDNFNYAGKISNHIVWKNSLASLNWSHYFSKQFILTSSAFYSNYDLNFGANIQTYSLDLFSTIKDKGGKFVGTYYSDKSEITFGTEAIHHEFLPNKINALTESVELNFGDVQVINAVEYAFYVNHHYKINPNLSINYGLRNSGYWQIGPFSRYLSDETFVVVDTVNYQKNKKITKYQNLEPRISIRYLFNEHSSIKASYDYNSQYVHMVPMSSVSLPTDMWVPSSENIKPQLGQQFALGYFRNFPNKPYEASIILFYKKMSNQIEYRNGVIVGYSKGLNFDDNYFFGKGSSKGIEMMIEKKLGRLTGSFSYTLGKTDRKFDDIDEGKPFPAKYDRRHDLSITNSYQINKRWRVMSAFVYATGNALTLPIARFIIDGNVINEYGGRNQFRMPAYHRLDLSAEYILKKTKNFNSSLNFSVYNSYNRRNPYYIYFDVTGNINDYQLKIKPVQVSLFPVIPALTYRFEIL